MENIFHANAKLMISGEYLVLDGALALAVPLNVGQSMKVTYLTSEVQPAIYWQAIEDSKTWFEGEFNLHDLSIINASDDSIAERLKLFFVAINELAPECFRSERSIKFETNNEFRRQWGLGTSSALLVNLSRWAGVNPFELHFMVSNGSGYDIAAAMSDTPIFYQVKNKVPKVKPVSFYPPFSDKMFMVYMGNKQFSDAEVTRYEIMNRPSYSLIEKISDFTRKMVVCSDLKDFSMLIELHEKLLSHYLQRPTIGSLFFDDLEGTVKSLGAWGGDFVLMICDKTKNWVKDYLKEKGFSVVFEYNELVSNKQVLV